MGSEERKISEEKRGGKEGTEEWGKEEKKKKGRSEE